jgi:pSer/pThr/pTyr-binding forkhead associated (FHA) protein
MAYQLVVVRGRSAAQALRLGDAVTTVGRHEACQLRIRSSQVSRKHCQFFEKKGLLIVKDLGSSNGTFVNGQKVDGQRVLEPGDELDIGQVKLRVEKVAGPSRAATKPGDTAVAEAVAVEVDEPLQLADTEATSVDEEEVFEIDFDEDDSSAPAEVEAEVEAPAPPKAAAQPKAPGKPAEVNEDDVAGFLLDLDVDEDDK